MGRLAPSPTGSQHVGNARTYLIAWLSARSQNGRIVLRIEDIDSPRVKAGATESLFDDLRWLGLDWDDGPIVQSQRLPLYQAALERLKALEAVYPFTCTRGGCGSRAAGSGRIGNMKGPIYPGTCASSTSWRCRRDHGFVPIRGGYARGRETITYDDGFARPDHA